MALFAETHVDTWAEAIEAWRDALTEGFESRVWDNNRHDFVKEAALRHAESRLFIIKKVEL